MELSQGTLKASKFASEDLDYISTMPDIVVTSILDRLPLQYAMRTSALSRNWRFKWTMLSQLVIDREFYEYLCKAKREEAFEKIISRILLNLKGAVTKFVLDIYIDDLCDDNDIAHWILFLSRKGVKDLTIIKWSGEHLELSSHLFSCLELEHLEIHSCFLDPPDSFHGFPNLLSLKMGYVQFKKRKFGEFLTQCPLLKNLQVDIIHRAKVKVAELAKLTNLEVLHLLVRKLENKCSRNIFALLGFLPRLQELKLDFRCCKSFTESGTGKRSSNTFPCLECLELSYIDLENGILLSFAFEIIRSCPNLQTLEIIARELHDMVPPATCSSEIDYNTMQLLELQSVVFKELKGSENEMCLIKFLLKCSPFLEEIVIHPYQFIKPNEKSMLARKLLKLHSAFPDVEIKLC